MKETILIHLDTDACPSVFDRIVALDAGADDVMSYGGVGESAVYDDLVFSCTGDVLRNTSVQ